MYELKQNSYDKQHEIERHHKKMGKQHESAWNRKDDPNVKK